MGTKFQFYKMKRVLEMGSGDSCITMSTKYCFKILTLNWLK